MRRSLLRGAAGKCGCEVDVEGREVLSTIEELYDGALAEIVRRTDRLGVVSVYVDAEPVGNRAAAAIDINNRYRELQRRIEQDENSRELRPALERVLPEVARLTSPHEPGRGRIAFLALSGDWTFRLNCQMPVPNRVVLDERPFIHPLLELLDEGQPAGVALVSGEDARLLEWRLGNLQLLDQLTQDYVEAPHERAGQIGGGPPGQFHTPVREHRQSRRQDWAERFLGRVGEKVAAMAGERGWERILVSGGERWTDVFAETLPEPLQEGVIRDPRVLAGLDDEGLRLAVTECLHTDHRSRERRLAERVRDAGLGGAAALGLSEVTAALNEGRVAHLIYDPGIRYTGSVGEDGMLHAGAEAGAGGAPGKPEPRLTERLVERALATAARISPLEGAAEGALSEAAGIGAFLRW